MLCWPCVAPECVCPADVHCCRCRLAAVVPGSARRPSTVEPPIPEDSEADVALPEAGEDGYSMLATPLPGRGAFLPHSTEAAALRGLGMGPSPLTRLAAALLLREVLQGVMSASTIQVLLHGVLLPALHMKVWAACSWQGAVVLRSYRSAFRRNLSAAKTPQVQLGVLLQPGL